MWRILPLGKRWKESDFSGKAGSDRESWSIPIVIIIYMGYWQRNGIERSWAVKNSPASIFCDIRFIYVPASSLRQSEYPLWP